MAGALLALSACAAADPAPAQPRNDRPAAPAREAAASAWARSAVPVTGAANDHDALIAAIGDANFVLLGESTHGTHEFYRERARISERLVRERGVGAIAIEGDWSAARRVNAYVRGLGSDRDAAQALAGFTNFPQWMWPNADFAAFIERLRAYNTTQPAELRVGVYGMDVYDLFDAADAVLAYLGKADPAAAARARTTYRCFASYGRDTHAYGEAARRASRSCQEEAAAVEAEVRRLPRSADPVAAEAHFAAVRAAASVAAAEAYFRTVYAGSMAWNVRDQQMARNVEEIARHVAALSGREPRVVVWGHNTHSGDARATFAANRGELNLGQLLRQRHGQDAFLVGFLTYGGKVFAAPEWDAPGRVWELRPALPESYAGLFHQSGLPAFSLVLRGNAAASKELGSERLERAVGVIYAPETERQSHYFEARLADQFDAILYFDQSRPVVPLARR